uniref:Uncharacterized protein n=1 Tax=Anopheles dirus TaxID=7168 RepID=A0A182N0S3_9DIPT
RSEITAAPRVLQIYRRESVQFWSLSLVRSGGEIRTVFSVPAATSKPKAVKPKPSAAQSEGPTHKKSHTQSNQPKMKSLLLLSAIVTIIAAQRDYTTPVPILKQINRHNEDGSYSYGYEAADGTFKIETKYPNGEVQGKYGYVDDGGKLREIEYGASNRGFEPQGTDINVPPPTLSNNNYPALGPNEEDDGQYREDPSIYYKDSRYNSKPAPQHQPRPAPVAYNPAPQQYYRNTAVPQAVEPQPQHRFQPQPQHQQQYYQPAAPAVPQQRADYWHPNAKVDINTGSYSLSYTGR